MRDFNPPPKPPGDRNHRSLRWRRIALLTIGDPTSSEKDLLSSTLTSHWRNYGYNFIDAEEKSLIFYDEELVGSVEMSRDPRGWSAAGLSLVDAGAPSAFADVPLAYASGLAIDIRIQRQLSQVAFLDVLRRCGPSWSELYVRRFGLSGYLTLIPLPKSAGDCTRISPQAYLQQVRARSIVDPLLTVYLEAGATDLKMVDHSTGPAVLLGWKNPR